MKNFLAVNIAPVDLNEITSLLSERTADFKVLTSKKIEEVDKIIKALPTDIVIIDLDSPSPQTLKTLDKLSKSHPRLPIIVLTAFETGEIASAIKAIVGIRHFEKPVDFKEVVDAVWEKFERSVGGQIHGISLTSFLQMSEMEKTSCTLKVNTDNKNGVLYLLKGALIAAESGELKNEAAVFDILSWENPDIEIDDTPIDRKKEIETPLISLLMESAQRKDDTRKDNKVVPEDAADAIKAAKKAAPKKKKAAPAKKEKKAPEPEIIPEELKKLKAEGRVTDASKILKRQQLIKQGIRALTIVIIIIVAGCIWQFFVSPWLAQRKLNNVIAGAKSAKTTPEKIKILDGYLESGPDSKYADQAEAMKRTYAGEVETLAFERTIRAVEGLPLNDNFLKQGKQAYQKLLDEYPNSSFKNEINKRIASLPKILAEAEYAHLTGIPDHHYSQRLKAYQSYLTKFPDNANAPNVRKFMNNLGYALYEYIRKEKAACDEGENWQRCLMLCQYFQNNFIQHDHSDNISGLQRNMNGQIAYIKLVEQIENAGPFARSTEKILKKYLEDHPDSPARGAVETQLADIHRKKNMAKNWQQLIDYVQNDKHSIFDRVKRMENYLNQNPSEKHVKDAENIHAWLLKKKQKAQKQISRQADAEKKKQQQKARIDQEKKKVKNQIKQASSRYAIIREDTITDKHTGLTWCMLDSSILSKPCLDYRAAKKYVGNLKAGGYNDWRLPDPGELLVIYNSTPAFPVSNARKYWTSEVFYAAWKEKVNTIVRTDAGTWAKTEIDLEQCGAVRAVRP